jgi:hypothetical protein
LNYFHFLTQENVGFKLSEIMVGSGIRKKPIPDPGSRGQKGPGSGSASATLDLNDDYHDIGIFLPLDFFIKRPHLVL